MGEVRRVTRGKKFPRFPLEEAIKIARRVRELGGKGVTLELLARAEQKSEKSGHFRKKVAAAKFFGLLGKNNEGYFLTELGKKILSPMSEEEEREALKEAFLNVPMFRAVYNQYLEMGGGKLPERRIVENLFERKFGVHPTSKAEAYKVFVESGIFAGLLEERKDGIYVVSKEAEVRVEAKRELAREEKVVKAIIPVSKEKMEIAFQLGRLEALGHASRAVEHEALRDLFEEALKETIELCEKFGIACDPLRILEEEMEKGKPLTELATSRAIEIAVKGVRLLLEKV